MTQWRKTMTMTMTTSHELRAVLASVSFTCVTSSLSYMCIVISAGSSPQTLLLFTSQIDSFPHFHM